MFENWRKRRDESVTKIENLPRDITPRVMGPCPLFCQNSFLTLETKCGMYKFYLNRIINIKVIKQMNFDFLKTYQGT